MAQVLSSLKQGKRLKALLRGISLSESGSEGFRVTVEEVVRVRFFLSVVYSDERPTQETQAEQYSDTVLPYPCNRKTYTNFLFSSE